MFDYCLSFIVFILFYFNDCAWLNVRTRTSLGSHAWLISLMVM